MSYALIPPRNTSLGQPSFKSLFLRTFSSVLFYIFIAITAVAVFIPLNPKMPSIGLDPSWQFALNTAVAQHLSFGRDIVYFYGPYASIGTRTYAPETDLRMMCGSLLVGISYITALLFLARGRRRYLVLVLLLFLATFATPEQLLLSYSFLPMACVLKQTNFADPDKAATFSWQRISAVLVIWSTLGLCTLVKGTLLLPVAASVLISSIFLFFRARFILAAFLLLIPIAAIIVYWTTAGQSFADLLAFMHSTLILISGYTEAMATTWSVLPSMIGNGLVIAFVALSALVCFSIACSTRLTVASKWALTILFVVFLLEAFKHGFVVVSGMSGAFASLAIYIVIICFLYVDKYLMWSLFIVMILTAVTSVRSDTVLRNEVHDKFGVGVTWRGERREDVLLFCLERALGAYSRTTYISTWNTYSRAWDGLRLRARQGSGLENRYAGAIANIRMDYDVPPLKGSADLYTNDQSVLLSSNNMWNPRPMFQSSTSYTPVVMRLNEQHLRGPDAPDWVLFELDTIDERLPSLEDGLSWPALFDNYTFVSYDGRFVLMQKKQLIQGKSNYDDVYKKTCKTGASVALPETNGLLFAEVDMKPTLLGRLLIALYKPPQLHIILGLRDGRTRSYRVISNMMMTGFVVSPFVGDTRAFASLVGGSKRSQKEEEVESISIEPSYGGSWFWSGTYALTLKRYLGE